MHAAFKPQPSSDPQGVDRRPRLETSGCAHLPAPPWHRATGQIEMTMQLFLPACNDQSALRPSLSGLHAVQRYDQSSPDRGSFVQLCVSLVSWAGLTGFNIRYGRPDATDAEATPSLCIVLNHGVASLSFLFPFSLSQADLFPWFRRAKDC